VNNDKDQIKQVFEEVYATNVRSGNLQSYASMYAENALWMPPGEADRQGVTEIVKGFAAQIAEKDIDPTFTAEEIEVIGDFGYVVGISEATIHPKDGSASKKAKFRALWLMKKEQGIWKIDRQIWNSKPL